MQFDPKEMEKASGLSHLGSFTSTGALVVSGDHTFEDVAPHSDDRVGFIIEGIPGAWHVFVRRENASVSETFVCSEQLMNNKNPTALTQIGRIIVEGARASIVDRTAQSDSDLMSEMDYGGAPEIYSNGFVTVCGAGDDGVFPVWVRKNSDGKVDAVRMQFN